MSGISLIPRRISAAFRNTLWLFNLLGEFQRASRLTSYRQPATLRAQLPNSGLKTARAQQRTPNEDACDYRDGT
jgi:hypothetical protein